MSQTLTPFKRPISSLNCAIRLSFWAIVFSSDTILNDSFLHDFCGACPFEGTVVTVSPSGSRHSNTICNKSCLSSNIHLYIIPGTPTSLSVHVKLKSWNRCQILISENEAIRSCVIPTLGMNISARKMVVREKIPNTLIPVPMLMNVLRENVTNAKATIMMLEM